LRKAKRIGRLPCSSDRTGDQAEGSRLAGDQIGPVFMRDDAPASFGDAGAAFQQVAQSDGAFDQSTCVIVEKAEEFLFARHQSLEKALHRTPRFGALLAMGHPAASSGS